MTAAEKLAALRAAMAAQNLAAFIVPMTDEYQNEYVPAAARRVEYLTGFTGSAGVAVVLPEQAAFFTDSRYTLQAQQQVPTALYAQFDIAEKLPRDWLATVLPHGARLGYDPWLHSMQSIELLRTTVAQAALIPVVQNPLDVIWTERPAAPAAPVVPHGLEFAGETTEAKRAKIAAVLTQHKTDAVILSDPASIAWLLNVRGGDVPHTPLPLSFALLHADATLDWFILPQKLDDTLRAALGAGVRCHAPEAFLPQLQQLGARQAQVQLDPGGCASAIADCLTMAGGRLVKAEDPCSLPRACKNATEQEGTRAAHRRDGAALAQFFAWLAAQPPGTVTELQAEAQLESARRQQNLYCGPSFDTIAGSGPHGAIVHYRATPQTNRTLQNGELFLLDSGGQYRDGTTDVTRTVAIGTPSAVMRSHYTRVVKGHIALATIRFPVGMTGADLDVLARQFLWAAGLDYGHGTGHGVGSYLSVHEGPQGISRRSRTALQPGMILSNEPGYYLPDHYGIRFENLMLVTGPNVPEGGHIPMLGFEVLTLAPLDRALLAPDLLTKPECDWIDAYHARVRAALADQLDAAARTWLAAATAPL